MKIGIFIGCFNPVHMAHVACAKELLEKGMIEKIIFVPVGDAYEKEGLVSAEHRLAMLEIVTKNEPKFEISDVEIRHGKLYTYQTLDYYKEMYPRDEIYLIIGTDNLSQIYWWKKQNYILKSYNIIVLTRDNMKKEDFPKYSNFENIVFVNSNKPVSSTEIRKFIKNKNYKQAGKLLDDEVLEYIRSNNLFEE